MEIRGRKRRLEVLIGQETGKKWTIKQRCIRIASFTNVSPASTSTRERKFPMAILELPVHLIVDILSRLPLKDILSSMCICKKILKLIKDPYFAKVHLARALTSTSNLILKEHGGMQKSLYFYTFDLGEVDLSSCCSDDRVSHSYYRHPHPLSKLNADFLFCGKDLSFIGSCNGLLCLYFGLPSKPFYIICNPILQEYTKLPDLDKSMPSYIYSNHSGFGFCSVTKKYKVIHFLCPASEDGLASKESGMVADIHTLGSDSWRRIKNPVWLKQQAFDPFVNGALHWVTMSKKPSDIIISFDLETEQFRFLPPPPHFSKDYMEKVSWINIGVLRECLCLCYIYDNVQFEAWVMKVYGVKESWTKEFSIDMKFYCKLQAEDFRRPIKFLSNGDLCFLSASDCLVSFSPKKRTFRELKNRGTWRSEPSAHVLSFVSLKDAVGAHRSKFKKLKWGRVFNFGLRYNNF